MLPYQISELACLLPADTTPEEAVKEAKELWEQARKLKLDKAFPSYDLAKRAASIPGRLTIEQRIERVKETYYAARGEALFSGTKPAWGDDDRLPGLEEEARKIDALPFTEGMLMKDFLKLVLTKKKTHGDRLAIYRKFLREKGDFIRDFRGVSIFTKNQKSETTDNCPVEVRKRMPKLPWGDTFYDRFKVVEHAALFNLWFRADEKKTLSERGSKGGKANAAKKNPCPKKKSLATKKPRKNSL